MFSLSRFVFAVLLGVVLEVTFLAFGLHAGLVLGAVCRDSRACYWLLTGIYLVLGFALGMLLVPWSKLSVRVAVFSLVIVIGILIGWRAVDGW